MNSTSNFTLYFLIFSKSHENNWLICFRSSSRLEILLWFFVVYCFFFFMLTLLYNTYKNGPWSCAFYIYLFNSQFYPSYFKPYLFKTVPCHLEPCWTWVKKMRSVEKVTPMSICTHSPCVTAVSTFKSAHYLSFRTSDLMVAMATLWVQHLWYTQYCNLELKANEGLSKITIFALLIVAAAFRVTSSSTLWLLNPWVSHNIFIIVNLTFCFHYWKATFELL